MEILQEGIFLAPHFAFIPYILVCQLVLFTDGVDLTTRFFIRNLAQGLVLKVSQFLATI